MNYAALPIAKRTRAQREKALFGGSRKAEMNGGGEINVKKKKEKKEKKEEEERSLLYSEKVKMEKRGWGSVYLAEEARRKSLQRRRPAFEVKQEEEEIMEMEDQEEFEFCYEDRDYVMKKKGTNYSFDVKKENGKGCCDSVSGSKRMYVAKGGYGLIKKPGLQHCIKEKARGNAAVVDIDSSSDEDVPKWVEDWYTSRKGKKRRDEVLRIPKVEYPSSSEEDVVSSEESYLITEDEDEDADDSDEWLVEDSEASIQRRQKRRRFPNPSTKKVASRSGLTKSNLGASTRKNVASRSRVTKPNLGASTSRLRKEIVPPVVIDVDDEYDEDIPIAAEVNARAQRKSSKVNRARKEIDHSSYDDSNDIEELATVHDHSSANHGNIVINEEGNHRKQDSGEGDVGDLTCSGHQEVVNEETVVEKNGKADEPTGTKPISVPKDVSLFKLFVSTIWEKGGKLGEEKTLPEVEVEKPIYKFRYGVEDPKPVEKSANDLVIDGLWSEFDFLLQSREIGSLYDSENTAKQSVTINQSSLCSDGKHDFILDEQIGIKCRCCLFVKTDIRDIMPPLDTTSRYGGSGKKRYADSRDISMWEGFNFDDGSGPSQRSYDDVEGTVWDLFPRIKDYLYPHQQEGFEFLWRNIAGGIEINKFRKPNTSDSIGGCVISHAPGTGKTLLTIVFLQSYMEVFKECRAVIIAPCSMLLTWEAEFKKWKAKTPFHNLNSAEFSGKEDEMARELVQGKNGSSSNNNSMKWVRMVKLLSWSKGRSILGVSYSLFGKLAKGKSTNDVDGKEAEEIGKILLEKPSLLVLDEGHIPRNKRSRIWRMLEKIKTERRIILSGTPFQNNFEELYNTLSLVRPKFLDSIQSAKSEKKEGRVRWASLTSCIGKNTDVNLEEVRAMMAPFVHVHQGSILKENLPGLRDCVVVLNPPPLQMKLLEEIKKIPEHNGFELEHAISLVSLHPSLLTECGFSKGDKSLLDQMASKGLNLDEITSGEYRLDPYQGVKTRFLMELIPLTVAKNEKILVFSQYISIPFLLIKDQLHHYFNWTEGEEVLQMDGTYNMKDRQSMINLFNDPSSKVRILLASIKACNEGINLVGASRVVLLDVVWNPSVERQAISRAYRLGQTKVVYTYHLITSDTMEGDKYRKQVSKDRLSELVFSSAQDGGDKQSDSSTIHEDAILEEMVGCKKLADMFKEVIFQPKEADLVDTYI